MHFIWLLVGMPLFCAVYGVYVARKNRLEEEGVGRRSFGSPRRLITNGSIDSNLSRHVDLSRSQGGVTSKPRPDSKEHRKRVAGRGGYDQRP